jgi:nucleoside-triphosphatase THEP1
MTHIYYIRWFVPNQQRQHNRYIPFSQLCPFNLHSVTHQITKESKITENDVLDKNPNLRRVQSYSPNIRTPATDMQKAGESLMDIRTFVKESRSGDQSYFSLDLAAKKVEEWTNLARLHIEELKTNNGMARLELTFMSNSLGSDAVMDAGFETLIQTFIGSTKIYSGLVVANLAEISLLAFEGISNGLLAWFQGDYVDVPRCWNEFAEVWQYLTFVGTNFFSGRRCYDRTAYYTPRLGYLFSRPLINPTWKGINAALIKACVDGQNFKQKKNLWYSTSGMTRYSTIRNDVRKACLKLDKDFNLKFGALLDLVETKCVNAPNTPNAAVACRQCKRITGRTRSNMPEWLNHPCNPTDDISNDVENVNLDSAEFKKYLTDLYTGFSDSQKEASETILTNTRNCFLTGVAGSGKSHALKYIYPNLILRNGFACVCMTATTNIAASNINGITLTRFMGLVVNMKTTEMVSNMKCDESIGKLKEHIRLLHQNRADVAQRATLCKILIIDEVGMCDLNTFQFLDSFLREIRGSKKVFGGVRLILVGDVLQLPPIAAKKPEGHGKYTEIPGSGNFFFESSIFPKNFFIAYLRENHRQDDLEFLEALNKVRIGDSSVVPYINGSILKNHVASRETLDMAREKNNKMYEKYKMKIERRISYKFLYENRVLPNMYNTVDFQNRLSMATRKGYSDLIVCLEHNESKEYTYLSGANLKKHVCTSVGSPYNQNAHEIFDNFDSKLCTSLDVYIGMPCRITYRTSNPHIVPNTLVVIKDITLSAYGYKVEKITVETTSTEHRKQTVILDRITLSENHLGTEYSRSQFPIMCSVSLLPWSLQCLTISKNIFYDNTYSGHHKSNKGSLYSVMSRVKSMDQLSFLYPFTNLEITNGVNAKAKEFDDMFRLRPGVIFNIA